MCRHLTILFLAAILAGCNENVTRESKSAAQSSVLDTIVNEYDYPFVSSTFQKNDTTLFIDNEEYLLRYTAKIDTSAHIFQTEVYSYEGKNYRQEFKGYNATYTITLTDKPGDTVFTKILDKDDFEDTLYKDVLTRSDAQLPKFLGYLETFGSFVFSIDFMVPDSDVGGQCLFLINRNGQLVENSLNNYFGGGDCDGEIEIPSHHGFILSCRKIINADGTQVKISDENDWQVGTKLINDNTILIIQEFNDSTQAPNAKLIDNFGKTFKHFTYKGYYNTLGFVVPMYFDPHSQNYFLLDDKMKRAAVINKNQPLSLYTVDFAKMGSFNDDKKEGELVFEMELEYAHYTFAFDTLKNTFRKRND